jgi:hypothetical protein
MRRIGGFETRPEFAFMFESLLNFVPDYASEMWIGPNLKAKSWHRSRNG